MDRILIILKKKKKKKNSLGASSAPALGLNTIIFKHIYWMQQISGERLQDHWSSCYDMTLSTGKQRRHMINTRYCITL